MHPLIILSGPTASGKSKTALALAEHLGAEIISADSMQVYRHFDIGTAKPTTAERDRVTHHLIDILDPDEEFTAFEFKERALACIREIRNRGKIPVLVGGTGLYLKALLENRDCAVSVSPEIRRQVQDEVRQRGTQEMYAELARVDPVYAGKIQPTDPTRIERALGVHRETGKPLSEFHAEDVPTNYEFDSHLCVLETDRQHLYERINQRVDRMMDEGLKNEVASLLDRGYSSRLKPFQSIGYAQIVRHLEDKLPLDRAVYEIKRDTRHFAKRQLTWFKKMADRLTVLIDPGETAQQIKEKILARIPLGAAFMLCAWLVLGGPAPASASTGEWYSSGVHAYHSGKWDEAQESFRKLLLQRVDEKTRKRAQFLLANVYAQQKDYDAAKALFDSVLKKYPEMGDYIRLELARLHLVEGKWQSVLEQTSRLLNQYPHTLLVPEVRLLRAEAFEKLGKLEDTLKELKRVENQITRKLTTQKWTARIPEIIKRQIQLSKLLQNHDRVYYLLRRLYIRYPKIATQVQAKIQMDRMVINLSMTPRPLSQKETKIRMRELLNQVEYQTVIREIRAIQKKLTKSPLPVGLYFHWAEAHKGLRKRPQANTVLRNFLKQYPKHPRASEAHFLIAGNLWNLGNPRGALHRIQTLLQEFPNSKWAPKAMFYKGRIYEDISNNEQALKTYKTLARKYGQEIEGEMAAWRSGWVHCQAGRWQDAYDQFKSNLDRFSKGDLSDKNLFWMAKSAEKLKKKSEVQSLYMDLAVRFPFTYYGLQSRHRLEEPPPSPFESSTPFQKASYKNPRRAFMEPGRRLSSRERFHFKHAVELIELGYFAQARIELLRLGRSVRKNLSGVMWLGHWYNRAHAYADSLEILQLFKNFKTIHGEKELPRQFWINFYPPAYAKFIKEESNKYGLDPWLVKGLIRQESMYDTRSLSPAGARGLMQIMPKTAKRLFERSHPNQSFHTEALFEPDLNISLGVQYLNDLTRKHKGNGVYILITYNAGPKVLRAWLQRFRSLNDMDVFVESIPYPETRGYVKHVMRNHGIYKNLYPTPMAPAPANKAF